MSRVQQPCIMISIERQAGSFADDLNTRWGIVSGRVALLPRSAEIQPYVAQIRPSHLCVSLGVKNFRKPWGRGRALSDQGALND